MTNEPGIGLPGKQLPGARYFFLFCRLNGEISIFGIYGNVTTILQKNILSRVTV
jgi:hypothetical protein